MRGRSAVQSRLKNKNNMSNVGPFNFLQHLHNTCSKRLRCTLTCCSPCLWAAWAEWPIGFMVIQFSKIIFSPFSQMSAICKGQFARNHSFWLIVGAVGYLARGEIHCGRFASEISHHNYLCLNATWQRNDHCGKNGNSMQNLFPVISYVFSVSLHRASFPVSQKWRQLLPNDLPSYEYLMPCSRSHLKGS